MRRRTLLLIPILVCVALTDGHDLKFLHPKARMVIVGVRRVEIPVQIWIERHPDNRAYRIDWSGESCPGGSSAKTLDGDRESRVHPEFKPLAVSLTQAGVCQIAASVYGPGGKVRSATAIEIKGCGGGDEPC